MTFLKAIWHSVSVVSAGLFWLISLLLIPVGVTELGHRPTLGWLCLGIGLALIVVRIVSVPRWVKAEVAHLIGCFLYVAFFAVAAAAFPAP